ncbi:MAG: thioredoxin family protein [Planctomycetota bacterium]|nr:thioredoxin family protein [Planctomycetota bacterium]
MSTLAIALMQISLVAAAPTNSYATAYKATNETGRPLIVLVGADWCPGCRTMKQSVIPQLEKNGKLNQVAFATVNMDQEGELAHTLTRGGSIPQLIMYTKKGDSWKRELMVGAHSPAEVEAFIQKGVAQTATAKQASTTRPVSKTIQK